MTSTTHQTRSTFQPSHRSRLNTVGIVYSEWIKLRSLCSTLWSYLMIVLVQISVGLLFAGVIVSGVQAGTNSGGSADPADPIIFSGGVESAVVTAATLGVFFGQLIISVLGVLTISGEYSTGQIRSSLVAVPKRFAVLWAKALVFSVTTFVVGLVSSFVTYFAVSPIFSSSGFSTSVTNSKIFLPLIGSAGYLALIGLLALMFGGILRNTAGGISVAIGLLLVIPIVLGLIPVEWATEILRYLPGSAGSRLFQVETRSGEFQPWQALLILLGWISASGIVASVFLRRRDA